MSQVDFYTALSGLGDTIAANRNAAAKREAFAQATTPGPDGTVDFQRAILGLAQVDPQAAALLANRANHADAMKQQAAANERQARQDAFQREESRRAQSNADRSYGLQVRTADRQDDPTPANFVKDPNVQGGYRPIGPAEPSYIESTAAARARAAAAVPPENFTRNPDGSLAYVRGSTADPDYQAQLDAARARAKGDQPTIMGPGSSVVIPNKASDGPIYTNKPANAHNLSDDALNIRAEQWNSGDYEGATKNVGRGAQGGAALEAIANRAAEKLIAQGYSQTAAANLVSGNMQKFRASGIGQSAEARTSANREANLNLILKATDAAIPAALEQSEKVSRTGWVPVNQIIQKGQVIASNPELRKFGMANLQLAEHWARAMNPTGVMRESDRDLALHFLSTADSKETYKEVVGQLKVQITRERDSIRGGHGAAPAATAAQTELKNKYGLD